MRRTLPRVAQLRGPLLSAKRLHATTRIETLHSRKCWLRKPLQLARKTRRY
jgi:hypothetical protein